MTRWVPDTTVEVELLPFSESRPFVGGPGWLLGVSSKLIIMDKKHQVFVSSTYEDLQAERQEVMHVLLELDCIPSGMELFPAANDSQWELIKGVIDDCDYYVVIIAGRYGTMGPNGVSYTEMEYRYAVEKDKPVVAFLHGDPGSLPSKLTEKSGEGQAKLQAFRDFVQKRVCKEWKTADGLGSVVSRSLVALRKSHPAVGWIRADQLPETTTAEILELRKKVEKLEGALHAARTEAPAGAEKLAQGNEQFEVRCRKSWGDRAHYSDVLSWDDILYLALPAMMSEASESTVGTALVEGVAKKVGVAADYGHEVGSGLPQNHHRSNACSRLDSAGEEAARRQRYICILGVNSIRRGRND